MTINRKKKTNCTLKDLRQRTQFYTQNKQQLVLDTRFMSDMRRTYCFGSAVVKRVLYNDTETLMVRLQSHLLGSYVTDEPHTSRSAMMKEYRIDGFHSDVIKL